MARPSGAVATRMGAKQGSASGPYSGKAIPVGLSPNVQLVLLSYSGTFFQPFSLGGTSIHTALLGGIGLMSPVP
jgi:hypothetical protein